MRILNLGCGTKTSHSPDVINIDWSIYLRIKKNPLLRPLVPLVLKGIRRSRFDALPDNIVVHNLAKGIPFPANSVDAVYHSHLFEHLDRDIAIVFLEEIKRVLKPGGIQRISVPDMERLCRDYVNHISISENDLAEGVKHDDFVAAIIEQSVRKEARGMRNSSTFMKGVETRLVGDARQRGETHQWMYDRINLRAKLLDLGFTNPQIHRYNTSSIPNWNQYGLDQDDHGGEYKPESRYFEAQK